MVRRLIAAGLAAGGIGLVIWGSVTAGTALRAERAFAWSCDNVPASVPTGVWVRLQGCAVNTEYVGYLTDAKGQYLYRLRPLWRNTPGLRRPLPPSQAALAFPVATEHEWQSVVWLSGSEQPNGLTPLDETIGVIRGRTGTAPYQIADKPNGAPVATQGALIVDVAAPPTFLDAGIRAGLGIVLVAMVWLLRRYGLPTALTRPPGQPTVPVNWSRVLILMILGLVILWRGIQWYFDPQRYQLQVESKVSAPGPEPAPLPTIPSPSPAPVAAPAGLPEATREELGLLDSTDPARQLNGVTLLSTRAATPDLQEAVARALNRHPAQDVNERLICLQTRFEGPGTLLRLVAQFPRDRRAFDGDLPLDVSCTLDALIRRTGEAPEVVRDALMPAAYAANDATRHKVLAAFRSMKLRRIPPDLLTEASCEGPFQREALDAALALDALHLNPDLLVNNACNSSTSSLVRQELRANTDAIAARIIARVWADREDEAFARLAAEREKQLHDVSAALLEIVLDADEPKTRRIWAAGRLKTLTEVGPLVPLRKLSETLDPGSLKQSVDRTVEQLESLHRQGRAPQMRALN